MNQLKRRFLMIWIFLYPGINIDLLYINRMASKKLIVWSNPFLKTPYIFSYNKLVKFHLKTNTHYDSFTEYFQMVSRHIHSAERIKEEITQWAICVLYFVHLSTFEKIVFWRKMVNNAIIRNSQNLSKNQLMRSTEMFLIKFTMDS